MAELSCADYVAVGPVFATGTKADAECCCGAGGGKAARALTGKPLVAIGGITLGECAECGGGGGGFGGGDLGVDGGGARSRGGGAGLS